MDGVIVLWGDGILMVQQQLRIQVQVQVPDQCSYCTGKTFQDHLKASALAPQSQSVRDKWMNEVRQTHCVSVNNLSDGDVDDRFGDCDQV